MPKYDVELKEIDIYYFPEIEAIDENEALNIAYKLIDTQEGRNEYFNDSDGESEVSEL